MEKNPYNNVDKSKVHTYEGLETLLRWAEQCQNNIGVVSGIGGTGMDVMRVPETQQVNAILKRGPVINNNNHAKSNGYSSRDPNITKEEKVLGTSQLDLILVKLEKLEKLDKIENDLALTMDRVDLMEKRFDGRVLGGKAKESEDGDKCFNCKYMGHISKDCKEPCRICQSKDHTSVSCKNKSNQDFQANSPRNWRGGVKNKKS
ncbi:hypothetical protein BD770DRAFT_62041 [Pilaira anomala]|nr:hypothetical protein BD770DRAFT_62041 [Pilaira anomala]